MEAEIEAASAAAQERCTTLPVQNAARHAKFPSSLMDPGPCTAAIATRSISLPVHPGRPEDTDAGQKPCTFLILNALVGLVIELFDGVGSSGKYL